MDDKNQDTVTIPMEEYEMLIKADFIVDLIYNAASKFKYHGDFVNFIGIIFGLENDDA